MLAAQVEYRRLVEFVDLAVDAGAHESLRHQILHELHVLALAVGDDRREQHQAGPLGQCEDLVDHLADGLRLEVGAVIRTARDAGTRVQKAQIVVDLGDRAHGRTGIVGGRFLFDRDRRRQAIDVVDVGFLHHGQELPRIGRQ